MFIRILLCFSLLPLTHILSLGTTENILFLSHFCPPFRCLQRKDPTRDVSSPAWTVPTLSASPHMGNVSDHHLPGSLLYRCVHVPSVLRSPELDTVPPALSRKELSHPLVFWQHLSLCIWWHHQPSLPLQHITDLHSTWVSTRTFLPSCFLAGNPLAHTGARVCSFPGIGSTLSFIEFHVIFVSPFLQWQHNLLVYKPLLHFYVISTNTVNEIAQINWKEQCKSYQAYP